MSEQTPPATRTDAHVRNLGKWLTGTGVLIAALLVVIAVLATTVSQQSAAIGRLSGALTGQRDQFQSCKGKPATASGCATPVAAEPSVIVKQGARGPIGPIGLTGATGPQGPQGPAGPAGPRGPAGPVGPTGKPGPPPGCALLSTACIGAQGPAGPKGETGPKGEKGDTGARGETGPKGEKGDQGAQGEMGVQGAPGRGITSTKCVNGQWVVTYSDGTQEEPQGSCVVGTP